jgi:DNA modification methylase
MLTPPENICIDGQKVYFTTSENLSFLKDTNAKLIVTSPPYWNLKDYGHPDQIGKSSYEEYLDRLNAVWDECYKHTSEDGVLAINVGNRRHQGSFFPIAFDIANKMSTWKLWDILIWYIPNALPQPNHYIERLFDNKFEFIIIFTKGGDTKYTFHKPRVPQKYAVADPRHHKKNPRGRCLGNVLRIPAYKPPNVKQLGYHVAAYPEELVAIMLESFTNKGDVVIDPFVGSGTTLKVCRGMQRNGIGIEINNEFSSLIERRIMEPWEDIDWKNLDIHHSSTMSPGIVKPRKIHLLRQQMVEILSHPSLFNKT